MPESSIVVRPVPMESVALHRQFAAAGGRIDGLPWRFSKQRHRKYPSPAAAADRHR